MATRGIAKRKPIGQALGSENIWRFLLENLTDTVTLVDREGIILFTNRDAEHDSLAGETKNSLYDHLPLGCREHVRESLEAAFETGRTQYYEVVERHSSGDSTWYGNRIQPVRRGKDSDNAIITTTDITRYKSEASLAQGEGQFEESSRLGSLADLAAGIGHEINNPLAVVQGYAEVLLDSDLPERALYQIENIHTAAKRAARIVRDLNQLARHSEPARLRVNLTALVGQAIDLKKQEFRTRNIKFTTHFPEDLPHALVDPYHLMEALLNILTNAQQAVADVPSGGEICLEAQVLNWQVKLSVSDNGPGIAPENISKVFEPFFTTRTFSDGPGLGLSISYAIVRQNGGDLWAESTPGKGATLHMLLPIVLPD